MLGFVIDASARLPWCFAEEATPWTEGLLDRLQNGKEVRVPAHWPIGLIMAVRRRRLARNRLVRFAAGLAALPIRIEPPYRPAAWSSVLQVATEHNLAIYDAAYLELAQRTGSPLATLDGDLQRAARAKGAPLLEEP
jgi:predicted nucleic acid-binding protein